MSLDLVVPELADQLWKENDLEAALALQAIAATDTSESRRAWNILVETLMDANSEASITAGEALAYYAADNPERADEVLDLYKEALKSFDLRPRQAALRGLNLAAELSSEVRSRKSDFMLDVLKQDLDIELRPPEH